MTEWTKLRFAVVDVEGNGQQLPDLVELGVVPIADGNIGEPRSWTSSTSPSGPPWSPGWPMSNRATSSSTPCASRCMTRDTRTACTCAVDTCIPLMSFSAPS